MDAHEAYWAEQNSAVVFIMALQDLNQPYSCEQWGNQGVSGAPVIVHNVGGELFNLFHDSWNAFPTYVLIDHNMQVRAKPWTYDSNSNTSSCDGTNATMPGFSGGDTDDFIQYLVDDCGTLCEGCSGDIDTDGDGLADECDDCLNLSGDVNDDMIIDILDIIAVVNIIVNGGMGSPFSTDCEKSDADYNSDGIINILDIISIINEILSLRVTADAGVAQVNLEILDNSTYIRITSDTPYAGIEFAFTSDEVPFIELKDNSHISVEYATNGTITRMVAYSLFNDTFDSFTTEFLISEKLNIDAFNVVIGSQSGDAFEVSYSVFEDVYQYGPYTFELNEVYPNPFNPATEVQFSLPVEGYVELSAYNLMGQEVSHIFNGYQSVGSHSYTWDASSMPSGIYYIMLRQGANVQTTKAMLMK